MICPDILMSLLALFSLCLLGHSVSVSASVSTSVFARRPWPRDKVKVATDVADGDTETD